MKRKLTQPHLQMVSHLSNYVTKHGGIMEIPKGDVTHNKITGLIAKSYAKTHPKAFIGNLYVYNSHREFMKGEAAATTEYAGDFAYPYFADFVLPVETDDVLEGLLRQYNDLWRKPETMASLVSRIVRRVYELDGEFLFWV